MKRIRFFQIFVVGLFIFSLLLMLNFYRVLREMSLLRNELQRLVENIERLEREYFEKILELQKIFSKAQVLEVIATAYSSTIEECDSTPFISASGKRVFWGMIAMGKEWKFGTRVFIPYFGKVFTVLDRGGAIRGNRIDIWMKSKEEAINFGVKRLKVYILN